MIRLCFQGQQPYYSQEASTGAFSYLFPWPLSTYMYSVHRQPPFLTKLKWLNPFNPYPTD